MDEAVRRDVGLTEAWFLALLESLPDGIVVVDAAGRIALANTQAETLFDYPHGGLHGLAVDSLLPDAHRAAHRGQRAAFMAQPGTRPMGADRELFGRRRDGSLVPLEIRLSPIRTADGTLVMATIRDVAERRRTRQALLTSEAGLQRAQDLARMAHAIVNERAEVESWSKTFPALMGRADGQPPRSVPEWFECLHPDDRPRLAQAAADTRQRRRRSDLSYRVRDGEGWRSIRHIMETLPQNADDDGGLRTFNTLLDVTEQRQAEDKIRRLSRVHEVLSGINALIVRAVDRDDLFRNACRILVDTGRFSKAWIGLVEEGIAPIRFLAWAGGPDAYFADLQARLADAQSGTGGLVKEVLAGTEAVLCNDVANDPRVALRETLVQRGSLAFALFPLVVEGRTVGAISIHAPTPGFFDAEETSLLKGLAEDIAFALDRFMKADRLRYLANHDPLTGLPNRAMFTDLLAQQLPEAARWGQVACVALLDLVRFRRVNETLGRRAGDELLSQVACRLRAIDASVARIGADLFALPLFERRSAAELAREFELIASHAFDAPFLVGGEEIRMGCRIGAAVFPGDGDDAEALLRNAESALRRARSAVEPCVFYAPAMNASASEAMAIETRLRRAIERGEFLLHYQPKVRLSDRRICGVEALIRWQDPERGLVPPNRFIPVLEETGLIGAVGQWALQQALADLHGWRMAGAPPVRVAVNVSPLQLNRPDFHGRLAGLVAGHAEPESLELEITESVIMQDVDRKIGMLEDVRRLGVSIAVDDFGTGYSSLSYIARLPITALKIDRAFVTDMTSGPVGLVLVSSIIALAHSLKLKVVAEGVETEEQAAMLLNLDCDEAQGYLFSKPVPADVLRTMLLARGP